MMNLYQTSKDFKAYVDKYCIKHQLVPEEAVKHALIVAYAEYLKKRVDGKVVLTTEINCGC